MKTTLKRGIGRAAELNGNGRAVYPPEIGAPQARVLETAVMQRDFPPVARTRAAGLESCQSRQSPTR